MKWYKRLLVVFPLAVALFIGSTVSAWAQSTFVVPGDVVNEETHTITVNAESLNETEKEFIRDFLADGSNFYVCTSGLDIITFVRFQNADFKRTCFLNNSIRIFPKSSNTSMPIDVLGFRSDTGEPSSDLGASYTSPIFSFVSGCSYLKRKMFDPNGKSNVAYNLTQGGSIYYPFFKETTLCTTGDLLSVWGGGPPGSTITFKFKGINYTPEPEPPVSSEPEPEPEPTPPPVVSYPDFPVVGPTDNQYVPYDTTVWNQFAKHVKTNIGTVVTICFLLLAAIVGIKILVKIVNYYSN